VKSRAGAGRHSPATWLGQRGLRLVQRECCEGGVDDGPRVEVVPAVHQKVEVLVAELVNHGKSTQSPAVPRRQVKDTVKLAWPATEAMNAPVCALNCSPN